MTDDTTRALESAADDIARLERSQSENAAGLYSLLVAGNNDATWHMLVLWMRQQGYGEIDDLSKRNPFAEIDRLKEGRKHDEAAWQNILAMGYKSVDVLGAAGMGAPGKSNCLIDMVEEAVAEIARLRAENADLLARLGVEARRTPSASASGSARIVCR